MIFEERVMKMETAFRICQKTYRTKSFSYQAATVQSLQYSGQAEMLVYGRNKNQREKRKNISKLNPRTQENGIKTVFLPLGENQFKEV